MGKNDFNQVVHVEITTEQLMVAIACLSASMHELDKWLKRPEKKETEEAEYCREEKKKIENLLRVFGAAFNDIRAGWGTDR